MNRPLTVADTGIACTLVPAHLVERQAQQRAADALDTITMALGLAEMQLVTLRDVRRNGGLVGVDARRASLAAQARALADDLLAEPSRNPDQQAA